MLLHTCQVITPDNNIATVFNIVVIIIIVIIIIIVVIIIVVIIIILLLLSSLYLRCSLLACVRARVTLTRCCRPATRSYTMWPLAMATSLRQLEERLTISLTWQLSKKHS